MYEKFKAFFVPLALALVGLSQNSLVASMLPSWVVPIVGILAAVAHAMDTIKDPSPWHGEAPPEPPALATGVPGDPQ